MNMFYYFLTSSSFIMCWASYNSSTTQRTYLASTFIVRWSSVLNIKLLHNHSQFPSKARPIRWPSPFIIGEPELPPVMSLSLRKQIGKPPVSSAYCPNSFLRIFAFSSLGTLNSLFVGSSFSRIPSA